MPKYLNQEAWVENESGERYEEYGTEVKGNVVTCYIASEADKIFSLHWQRHECSEQTDCRLKLYVDGIRVDSVISQKYRYNALFSGGHYQDVSRYKPYKFANILFSDEDQGESGSELGAISIKSYRVVVVEPSHEAFKPITLSQNLNQPMNEKAKKLGCLRVGLDDDEKKAAKARGRPLHATPYMGESSPYVDFVFIYRPKDILRALGFLPLSQSLKGNAQSQSISPCQDSEPSRDHVRLEKKKRKQAEKRKREDEKEEAALLAQQAELARKLEEIRKRRKVSAEVKEEVKQEDIGYASFQQDKNGAIDLTLDD